MKKEMTNTFVKTLIEALKDWCQIFKGVLWSNILLDITNALENTSILSGSNGIQEGYEYDVFKKHISKSGSRFNVESVQELVQKLFIELAPYWLDVTKKIPDEIRIPGCRYFQTVEHDIGVLRARPIKEYLENDCGSLTCRIVKTDYGFEVQREDESEILTPIVTLITGPASKENTEPIIYTIHPGDPMEAGNVDSVKEGEVTLKQAYEMGFRTVKFV